MNKDTSLSIWKIKANIGTNIFRQENSKRVGSSKQQYLNDETGHTKLPEDFST